MNDQAIHRSAQPSTGLSRLARLRDRHAGQRCVIVANGPSLNQMDLAFLRGELVIGLNKIYLGLERFRFYPRYLVMVNQKVISQSVQVLPSLRCVKFLAARAARQEQLAEDALTYHIETDKPLPRFSKDLVEGMHEGWTVTHCALQVAYFLGFSEVVLIGLDHRYEYQGEPNQAQRMEGRDPNHFSEDYFGFGQVWDNPDLTQSEMSYSVALAAYAQVGRRILDATLGGACPVFPKVDYKKLFSA